MNFYIMRLVILFLLLAGTVHAAEPVPAPEEMTRAEQRVDAQFPYLVRKRDAKPGEVELGAALFFDPRLSSSGAMACASCHQPSQTFTDGLPRAVGLGHKVLKRNTPSLTGGRYRKFFFWDGRARSVEEAAMTALQNPEEMNQTLPELERLLASMPGYAAAFARVYGPGAPRRANAATALAAFVEGLVTFESAFDRFHEGGVPMKPAAQRGLVLFTGKAGCVRCHASSNFSSESFFNLGLPGDDPGHFVVTGKTSDRGAFRVPSLRNVALTPPYMHDGSLETLGVVVDFHSSGLNAREKEDLIAFLGALTSPPGPVVPPLLPLAGAAQAHAVKMEKRDPLAPSQKSASWSPLLAPVCADGMDALLAKAVSERWRDKDSQFVDSVFLPLARRYYLYQAIADANPGRCASLAAFSVGPEEGSTSEGSCREVYYEMTFAQALGKPGPQAASACEASLAHQATLGPADARELCGVLLSRRDEPAKACALFQPKYLDRHQVQACENGMRIYTGDPRTCGNIADLAEHLAVRCEAYPLFRRAASAGDIELCGASERCRVLMGGGKQAAAAIERSLTDRACGRAPRLR